MFALFLHTFLKYVTKQKKLHTLCQMTEMHTQVLLENGFVMLSGSVHFS